MISNTHADSFVILGKDDSIYVERNLNVKDPDNIKYDINLKKSIHSSFEMRDCSDDEEEDLSQDKSIFFKIFCPCMQGKKKYVKM